MRLYPIRVAILVLVLGGAGLVRSVSAQEPPPAGTMGIWFPDPEDVGLTGFTLDDELGGSIAIFASGVLCGSFDVSEPMLVLIGAAEHPDACRTVGAHVDFANEHGHMMSFSTVLEVDAIVVFNNFAPWPPHGEYPKYACGYFETSGIESSNCPMRPGVQPGGSGNSGIAATSGKATTAQLTAFVVVAVALVAGARRSSRHFRR